MPVKVLYKGEPLVKATVTASSDTLAEMDLESTHDHREPQGFSGKTDKNGVVNVITLIDGLWKIKVVNETDYGDKSVCQKDNTYATLIVPVGTKRAGRTPCPPSSLTAIKKGLSELSDGLHLF